MPIKFENAALPDHELVRVQAGAHVDPVTKAVSFRVVQAKDVPVGELAWQINQRGLPRGERCCGRRL